MDRLLAIAMSVMLTSQDRRPRPARGLGHRNGPVLELPRILGADDVSVRVEVSSDLTTWEWEGQKYARVIVTQNQ